MAGDLLAVRRQRGIGRLRTGAALLCVEGGLVTLSAIGLFPMTVFAGIGGGGEQAVVVAMILDGLVVLTGLFSIVIGVLAMRGSGRAGWIGVVLSVLCAAAEWISQGDSLGMLPRVGLTVVLALPAIYLAWGLLASGVWPARRLVTVQRRGD